MLVRAGHDGCGVAGTRLSMPGLAAWRFTPFSGTGDPVPGNVHVGKT